MMLIEKSFDTGEVVLNYAEGPDNGPPISFIHGMLGRWEDFTHYYPQFTEKFHVFAIDTRGRGKSGRAPGKYHLKYMAQDLCSFIEMQIGEPTILLGHSEGGWIALWAAHLSPENVSALVILDSPMKSLDDFIALVKNGPMKDWLQRTKGIVGRPVEEIIANLREVDPSRSFEDFRHSAMDLNLADPEYLDLWSQGRFDEYFEGYDAWAFLRDVGCPIMIVQADPDAGAALSHDDVKKALQMNPGIEHVLVEGVGHNLGTDLGEEPIDVDPILSFLESLK